MGLHLWYNLFISCEKQLNFNFIAKKKQQQISLTTTSANKSKSKQLCLLIWDINQKCMKLQKLVWELQLHPLQHESNLGRRDFASECNITKTNWGHFTTFHLKGFCN